MPAGHTAHAEQDVAFADDHELPDTQLEQVAFVVAVHAVDRKSPALHTLEPQLRQGAKPVAEKVPAAHGGEATQASVVAFQT